MVEQWLAEAARKRVGNFAAQLRTVTDTSTRVPNLEWTVADLAQHIACLPSFWGNQHANGANFTPPEDWAAHSNAARAHITETDANTLADLMESEFGSFIDMLSAAEGDRWVYGIPLTPSNFCGLTINETIMHGGDLAAVTGMAAPTYTRQEANACADAMMATTPVFLDHDKVAAQPDGVYGVKFKDGNDYTWTKSGRDLTITTGRPQRADARMIADPATFLMSSLGRISQTRAAISGKMFSYGFKPWRFLGLGGVAVDGV